MNTRPMEDFARLARFGNFEVDDTKALRHRVKLVFQCWGQENLIESAMQKLTDHEDRDSASRDRSPWTLFHTLTQSSLITQFGAKQIDKSTHIPMTGKSIIKSSDSFMFKRKGKTPSHEILKGISEHKNRSWETFDAQTLRKIPGEIELVNRIVELDDYTLLGKCWAASLLPVHQVIGVMKPGEAIKAYFVLNVTDKAAQVWPIRRHGARNISFQRDPEAVPVWKTFFEVSELHVLTTFGRSPVRTAAESREIPIEDIGVVYSTAKHHNVVDWQANHGFAGVSECTLKLLHTEWYKIPLPAADDGEDIEMVLASHLVKHAIPDCTEPLCTYIMQYHVDHTEQHNNAAMLSDELDPDAFLDVAERKDLQDARKFRDDERKRRASVVKRTESLIRVVKARFPGKPKAAVQTQACKDLKKANLGTVAGRNRWWAHVDGDSNYIDKFCPTTGRVTTDNPNGRWLLTYSGGKRKSVSWTKKGCAAASLDALKILWDWHTDATGEAKPVACL